MRTDPDVGWATPTLAPQDLMAGSALTHRVEIPGRVLRPTAGDVDVDDGAPAGAVTLRPLGVGVLALISRASRDDPSLAPLLMIKESMVEPAMDLDQLRRMHVGLVHFLVTRVNLISGLGPDGDTLDDAAASAIGRSHVLLARHFGWTPEQVSQLTPAQVAVYLAGIETLLRWERGRTPDEP